MLEIVVLYLFTRVDDLRFALGWCIALTIVIAAMRAVAIGSKSDSGDEFNDIRAASWWKFVVIFLMFVSMKVAVPSKVDMAIIVGGKLAVDAVRSETAEKVLLLVNETLDEQLASIRKAKAPLEKKK